MVVDGKAIASALVALVREKVCELSGPVRMGVVVVGEDPATLQFIRIKERVAAECGIQIDIKRFSSDVKQEDVVASLLEFAHDPHIHGVVLQLPLPTLFDTEKLISCIPIGKDVDVLSRDAIARFRMGELDIIPPVAAAVGEILERYHVNVSGKEVLVIGHGRLVGAPVALLLRHNDAHVTVIDQPIKDLAEHTRESDVIISGTGVAMLITPAMLRDGVVLIDAGTSESNGKVVGDISPECATMASVFTPVPGGVGPITVAMLMKNCYRKARNHYALGDQ